MQVLEYAEEHEIFRDAVRGFLEREVVPNIEAWEAQRIVPREIWRKMGEQGFLCMNVPERYGGFGVDFLYSVILTEELIRSTCTGLAAPLHSDVVVPYITTFGSEELKQRLLPGCVSGDTITALAMTEPSTGSDLAAIRTTAVEDGDEVIINGQKTFISNGILCDLVVVAARNPASSNPHTGLDLYVVEAGTPGFEKGSQIEKIGWHAQDTAELFFEDCRVPAANRLGTPGSGFRMMMSKLQQERLVVSLMAARSAENCLDWTVEYCNERSAFGRPIGKLQNTRFRLAEMATEVKLGRTFVDQLVKEHMAGHDVVQEVSMAKYWVAEMAMRVADGCLQLFGGYGYCEEYPIARAWRDMRVLSIFAGTSEIMKTIVAKSLGL